jgi:hypothetical protein
VKDRGSQTIAAAYPEVIATSAEKGSGIEGLRAAILGAAGA